MSPLLPRLALHALARTHHPILVASRRGQVLHLVDAGCCHPNCSLTPTGRLRQGHRPLCGTRGRAWHFQDLPTRPLCEYCTAIASRHERRSDWSRLDVVDVLRAAAMATDAIGIDVAGRALLEAGLLNDPHARDVLRTYRQQLGRRDPLGPRDIAWLPTLPLEHPLPHPPVRHNFAA